MKPLSLAVVRQRFAGDGGAERFVARMLDALKGQDIKATLITREWERTEGASVIIIDPFYIGRLWRDWSFARAVRRLLKSHPFDIVQSHERIPSCDIYRAGDGVHREWLAQLARTRGPLGRLGLALNPYHHYVKRAEKKLFTSPRLRAVICNSRMVRDEVRHHFGVPEEKLHVIYSGVDVSVYHSDLKKHRAEIRARYGIPDSATLFLFVGSGFERKGVMVLLEAMAELPPDACLLVVGHDKKLGKYRHSMRGLGLTGRVHFLGRQPDAKPFYGAADALVLPTLYDPFPNVALEGFACGLPVITSTRSGAAELIEEGHNGFVCDALDRAGLAARMRRLMTADRAVLARAARSTIEDMEPGAMRRRLLRLYQSILSA